MSRRRFGIKAISQTEVGASRSGRHPRALPALPIQSRFVPTTCKLGQRRLAIITSPDSLQGCLLGSNLEGRWLWTTRQPAMTACPIAGPVRCTRTA